VRPLRYSINVTLDGSCDHQLGLASPSLHRHVIEEFDRADELLFGRVIYQMMESAWREVARTGNGPEWMLPFARKIDAMKKYVVSSTIGSVDWNAELVHGDLLEAVRKLKQQPGKGLLVAGVTLPLPLADAGLIDEYELIVHPVVGGRGPYLFAGLSKPLHLELVSRQELDLGVVAMRYQPKRA
jgi:dihydrofolate reductase